MSTTVWLLVGEIISNLGLFSGLWRLSYSVGGASVIVDVALAQFNTRLSQSLNWGSWFGFLGAEPSGSSLLI